MDWKKAKTLMIYVFIFINVFLVSLLYIRNKDRVDNFDIVPILENHDIKLEAKIPQSVTKDVLELNYKVFTDDEIMAKFFDSPVVKSTPESSTFKEGDKSLILLNNKQIIYTDAPEASETKIETGDDAAKYAQEFLRERDLDFNLNVQKFTESANNNFTVEFEEVETNSGYFLEDAFAIVYLNENGVTGLKYQAFSGVNKLDGKVSIRDPKRKLLKIIKEPIAKGRRIVDVSVNYYFNPSNLPSVENIDKITSGIANLALRVTLDNGAIIQID